MKRIIHVETKKIVSHDAVGNPITEKSLVKLIDQPEYLKQNNRSSFAKFVKNLNANRYKENPLIIKVVDYKTTKELDTKDYQDVIDSKISEAKSKKKVDYKKLAKDQELEIKTMKIDFEERLRELEGKINTKPELDEIDSEKEETPNNESESNENDIGPDYRDLLEQKANELNITFRSNIGDVKLLGKIQEIEPEFKID